MISAFLLCGFLFINFSDNTAEAAAEEKNTVYLGGMPIGIIAKSSNFTVIDFVNVITKDGSYSPAQKSGVRKGDVILAVNGQKSTDIESLSALMSENETAELTLRRKGEIIKITVKNAEDLRQKGRKVGLIVKNDLSGIGTVTYIEKNGKFGALGHPIADQNGNSSMYQTGKVYDCMIYGYKRAENEKAGELIGQIDTQKQLGTFYSNTLSGILGNFYEKPTNGQEIEVASQSEVKPGKAYVCTTIDGNKPSTYEIEIVKTTQQPEEKEKSMVIRVTDKNLLRTTGGILQGMSGSPIIQEGKLVGAVTHVLTSDPTLGYGIYIEWMMN